jgi:predicted cobalt transporter CbtA
MVGILLLRGMAVGALAGLLCFVFLKLVGEPALDRAIQFESASHETHADPASAGHQHAADHTHADNHDHADHSHGDDVELVSRATQSGIGLFTGVVVYSAAFGGLFALAFAFAFGRIGALDARATAALLAAGAFIALYLVPSLKYPANPPSIGSGDTIGQRTSFFFLMIVISLGAATFATMLRQRLAAKLDGWTATVVACVAYIAVVAIAGALLPVFDEVPAQFPANVLWQFRIASIGAQLLMWVTIGFAFGALTARANSVGSLQARTP